MVGCGQAWLLAYFELDIENRTAKIEDIDEPQRCCRAIELAASHIIAHRRAQSQPANAGQLSGHTHLLSPGNEPQVEEQQHTAHQPHHSQSPQTLSQYQPAAAKSSKAAVNGRPPPERGPV